ncbi:unnamed protein product [Durusdinium trenchii]|uniref:Transmembrane protein n=1 Tax=Durusdinium trenchii TaxID=1381693 RepID=A0ABP0MHF4_9DINO
MMDDSIVTRVSWTTVKEQHADLLFYAAESVQPPPLMESLKPLAPQPAVGSQAPCEAGARPYGMVNGVNGVNGKSRSPERVDALERHRSRQEVEDRRLGRSEVNGRSRCIFFTLAATFGSPEHSVQETLRPSASSESDPVRREHQALLDVESPPTQDTTVASTAPCSISRRVMCGMAWTLFSVCLLGWAVIFFMPTTETGRSDEVMELAQFKPETADDVEAEKAQFGQMASKAAELAKLLRVLRGKEQALNPVASPPAS